VTESSWSGNPRSDHLIVPVGLFRVLQRDATALVLELALGADAWERLGAAAFAPVVRLTSATDMMTARLLTKLSHLNRLVINSSK